MSHQPYETWLLSEENLDEEQQKALQTHLEGCQQCKQLSHSWNQVQIMINSSSEPEPLPGFSHRWENRLAIRRQQQQQRKMWFLTLGLFGLASLIFLGLASINIFGPSFNYQFSQTFASLARSIARISYFWDLLSSVVKSFPLVLPLLVILGVGGFSASMALIVTWFSSLIKFYHPVKEGVFES
ncbi:hypothetical protein JR338_00895 [Chloroflexota bacterium]|nr:hypothetical protein JR338_00895 [Chloroflexota bacterium]